jgi:cytochrome P450
MTGDLRDVPAPRGLPVLGHTVPFLSDARRLVLTQQARHGDVFRLRVLGREVLLLLSPDATRDLYLDRQQVLSSEQGWAFTIGPLFRGGLMLRDFEEHRLHRRAMQHAFRRAALAGYLERIHAVVDGRLAKVQPGTAGGVDMYRLMKQLTLDLAAQVFVGVRLGPQVQEVNAAFAAMMRASVTPVRLDVPGTTFHAGMRGRHRLEVLLRDLVAQRRAAPEGADLLSRLCHASTPDGALLSDDDVVDHMIFMLLAAHDTTTSALTVMLWELARHPDWQHRVRAEVVALNGADVTLERHPTLVTTGLVLKEALRLSPPVPFSPRVALARTTLGDTVVPAGTTVSAASLALHRHPAWWSSPDRFDPGRFEPGRAEDQQHSHLYVPFGGGAHLCIGNHVAELVTKVVVARLLARHEVVAAPGQRMRLQAVPIPKPRGGRLVLTLR